MLTVPLDWWTDKESNGDDYPVTGVCWYEAEAYANWAGARLPTEEEWEKAARGTGGVVFPWGDNWDSSRLNYCDQNCGYQWKDSAVDEGYSAPAPVGSYPNGASPYGAWDTAGNVIEWVNAWYRLYPDPRYTPSDLSETLRVLRGGSWADVPTSARCACRSGVIPEFRHGMVGFRLAQ